MPKVILHNLSIPYAKPNTGLYDFDRAGIFFAEAGDILVTRRPVPEAFKRYLGTLGYPTQSLETIYTKNWIDQTHVSIFQDASVKEKIQTRMKGSSKEYVLDSFMVSENEAAWANELDISYVGDPSHYHTYGNKSHFRGYMQRHGFQVPRGFSHISGAHAGAIRAALLFLTGASEVVVKQDEGVAALGSKRFTASELLGTGGSFGHLFPDPRGIGIRPTNSSKFVVEKWYQDVRYSPSIQLHVDPAGEVIVKSLHVQTFYADKMRYAGCYSHQWIDDDVKDVMKREGIKIGTLLLHKGFQGHFSLNGILLQNGTFFWVELNPRRVMSSYPRAAVLKLFGEQADNMYYMTKDVRKERWRGMEMDSVLSELFPVLYTTSVSDGAVPIHYNYLEHTGTLTLMCIGRSKDEVEHVYRRVSAL